ncbi:hypothetical protein B0H13DRAFT_1140358 [Mycena leptocephala]|nr:hypothetical protein B0H13DRAFT_1140358 [Mycena leptocephala]
MAAWNRWVALCLCYVFATVVDIVLPTSTTRTRSLILLVLKRRVSPLIVSTFISGSVLFNALVDDTSSNYFACLAEAVVQMERDCRVWTVPVAAAADGRNCRCKWVSLR